MIVLIIIFVVLVAYFYKHVVFLWKISQLKVERAGGRAYPLIGHAYLVMGLNEQGE